MKEYYKTHFCMTYKSLAFRVFKQLHDYMTIESECDVLVDTICNCMIIKSNAVEFNKLVFFPKKYMDFCFNCLIKDSIEETISNLLPYPDWDDIHDYNGGIY